MRIFNIILISLLLFSCNDTSDKEEKIESSCDYVYTLHVWEGDTFVCNSEDSLVIAEHLFSDSISRLIIKNGQFKTDSLYFWETEKGLKVLNDSFRYELLFSMTEEECLEMDINRFLPIVSERVCLLDTKIVTVYDREYKIYKYETYEANDIHYTSFYVKPFGFILFHSTHELFTRSDSIYKLERIKKFNNKDTSIYVISAVIEEIFKDWVFFPYPKSIDLDFLILPDEKYPPEQPHLL